MTFQHRELAAGRWFQFSLAGVLVSVGLFCAAIALWRYSLVYYESETAPFFFISAGAYSTLPPGQPSQVV